MFTVRTRISENIEKRQKRQFFDITASGTNIPLEGVNWSERWCSLPITAEDFKRLYEFQVKDNDIYVVTFPKCGTTWMQEIVWLLANNLDFDRAYTENLSNRSIFMELSLHNKNIPKDTIDLAEKALTPRVLKSHMPAHLIPKQIWEKKSKIVYVARNPKDVVVSYFHFLRGLGNWQGDIGEYVEDFINNDIMYCPYWENLIDFWRMREEKNIFFTTYEDMKRDLRSVLLKLNAFLEKPELNEKQLEQLVKHLSFDYMKANKRVNPTSILKSAHNNPRVREDFEFMRRGVVGSYKDELTPEVEQKLDDWIAQHLKKFNINLEDIFGINNKTYLSSKK